MFRTTSILVLIASSAHAEGNPRLDFATGILEECRGNPEKAGEFFESARLADPLAKPLVDRAVNLRMAAGDRSGAVKLYRDLAAARADDLGVQLIYADFLDAQANGDSLALRLSNETLEGALLKNPGHPEIIRRLFRHARTTGDKARQLQLMEMLSDDPTSALLYASLSGTIHEASDTEARRKVDDRYVASFEKHPEDPALARAASGHFRETGRLEKAIEILERHVQAAPSSLASRVLLGGLCFAAGKDAEGESTLMEVLAINPRQAVAHQSLAAFHRLRGQPDAARFHEGEALKIRGGSPADYIKLADEWLSAEQPEEARILLENSVLHHPDHRELAERLAIATRRDPETCEKSARLFRMAEGIESTGGKTNPDFLLQFSEALIAEGQGKIAEERLRSAIRAYPPDARKETAAALRRLAALWESEGRNSAAARALRQRADSLDH